MGPVAGRSQVACGLPQVIGDVVLRREGRGSKWHTRNGAWTTRQREVGVERSRLVASKLMVEYRFHPVREIS